MPRGKSKYEVAHNRVQPNEWNVEWMDEEGEVHCVIFSGPRAQELAREYAAWKDGKLGDAVSVGR